MGDELVRVIEEATPSGMVASILILDEDGRHLLHGAGPSLPDAYNKAIHGLEIGPEVGSCGTAAFHDKTVSVFDIANNSLWANFRDLALQFGPRPEETISLSCVAERRLASRLGS